MGYNNAQIGWSRESTILREVVKQLDQLIKVTASQTGVTPGGVAGRRAPQQIGWSQEAKLLSQVLDQLKRLTEVTSAVN
jgi:hypothetical protein